LASFQRNWHVTYAKTLIDRVSSFTNFFIVGTSGISGDVAINEKFQYAYYKGLSFMSFMPSTWELPIDFNLFNLNSYKLRWLMNNKNVG
jgi:hypothetical protein